MRPNIDKMTAYDLRDDERLKDIYVEAVRRKWWVNNPLAALEFFMYAEKALADDKQGTPGKLFFHLLKVKTNPNITQNHENKALVRLPSGDRQELVDRAGGLNVVHLPTDPEQEQADFFGENMLQEIGYMHSIMMQCFLSQKRQHIDVRHHDMKHGKASLRVEAGSIANPDRDAAEDWLTCPLPSGTRPRLIIPYINDFPVRQKTSRVDLGKTLNDFLEKLGISDNDYNRGQTEAEIQAIAACQFLFGLFTEKNMLSGAKTKWRRVADECFFWKERDPQQGVLFDRYMELSTQYTDALKEHRVPVNVAHLRELSRSPRRMDVYSWLSYRTPVISKGKTVSIKLNSLLPIFGQDIDPEKSPRLFKDRFKNDLKVIGERVYRDFRAEIKGDLLLLRNSPPPVPRQKLIGYGS